MCTKLCMYVDLSYAHCVSVTLVSMSSLISQVKRASLNNGFCFWSAVERKLQAAFKFPIIMPSWKEEDCILLRCTLHYTVGHCSNAWHNAKMCNNFCSSTALYYSTYLSFETIFCIVVHWIEATNFFICIRRIGVYADTKEFFNLSPWNTTFSSISYYYNAAERYILPAAKLYTLRIVCMLQYCAHAVCMFVRCEVLCWSTAVSLLRSGTHPYWALWILQ